MYRFAVFCVCIGACYAMQLTKLQDCGSNAVIHSVMLEPCSQEPCIIHKGHSYIGTVSFTPSMDSSVAINKATGFYAGVPVPFEMHPNNACSVGLHCPLNNGEVTVYNASITSPTLGLPGRLAAKWEMQGDNNKDILCFVFPVEFAD